MRPRLSTQAAKQADGRMTKILTEPVAVGNATARAMSFRKPRSAFAVVSERGDGTACFGERRPQQRAGGGRADIRSLTIKRS